jgi:hypothetical protein
VSLSDRGLPRLAGRAAMVALRVFQMYRVVV